jgi:CRP-like cAMP-binding protein/N-acyl-L-homoserine lactone synthetase
MAVKIKIAHTAQELRDVYKLRNDVYHDEEGLFQGNNTGYIIDIYDSIPNTVNIVAYSDGVAVGTIRIVPDSEIGTPSDESFDFSYHRKKIRAEALHNNDKTPKFISAGMLTIAEQWRNRRDIFRGLFRMAADVAKSMDMTHVIATVNASTVSIYKRLGWEILSEPILIEEIGNEIVAVGVQNEVMYAWAFDMLQEQRVFLEHFSGCFQWYLLDDRTTIFNQGDIGEEAYLITKGAIDINCHYKNNDKMISLAKLAEGDMFGELSLIDDAPRSASAVTRGNTELLVINQDIFWQKTQENPLYLRDLMSVLSARLRSADERAILYAHAPLRERMSYFINILGQYAMEDINQSNRKISKTTIQEFADMALSSEEEALSFLQELEQENMISLEKQKIIFLRKDV